METNYLEHYGRLGMKWGQHIFGRDKAVSYGHKKLNKYDTKRRIASDSSSLYKMDYYKQFNKAQEKTLDAHTDGFLFSKEFKEKRASKAREKALNSAREAATYENKSIKYRNKAATLAKNMKIVFGENVFDVDSNIRDLGKEYANTTLADIAFSRQKLQDWMRVTSSDLNSLESLSPESARRQEQSERERAMMYASYIADEIKHS